jgi:citrate lyase subunit beta/citryl-CoA lyase
MDIWRSMLFLPGNNPGMLQNGGVFGADAVILDLEDAVSLAEKDAARILVAQALRNVDYEGSKKIVRINPLDTNLACDDIREITPCEPDALLLPKVQSAADIEKLTELITAAERPGQEPVKIIALIETPRGLAEAFNIASINRKIIALAFGAEDYTAALGATRTKEGAEIFTARSLLVNAAAAAGIDAIDTPYTDTNDETGLIEDIRLAKKLGFRGKLAINPRQIEIIHNEFNPSDNEIIWAGRVVRAIRQAEEQGSGVTSLDGKMIDTPILIRARRILRLAKLLGIEEEEETC